MKKSTKIYFVVLKFLLVSINLAVLVRCDDELPVVATAALETFVEVTKSPESFAPIVEIAQGKLQGSLERTRNGQTYYGYLGIPYAKPPGRFQPPEPATIPGWEGVRNATIAGSVCSQLSFFSNNEPIGSEDCLFLNVYTKYNSSVGDLVEDEFKPVLVYIHGGGFVFGTGNDLGGDFLLDEPVVFVELNYRLSSFGFLNIGEWNDDDVDKDIETSTDADSDSDPNPSQKYSKVANGNMGLKDQTMALKWVKDNIKAFGGDPTKVTIFGTSAGSASVIYHVLSPTSAGLFHHAIAASGSALNRWAFSTNPKLYAKELGKALNCPTSDSTKLIKCLLEKDTTELITKSDIKSPRAPLWTLDPIAPFGPSIDSRIGDNQEAFLPKNAHILYREGEFNKVPLLIGINKNEGVVAQAGRVLNDDVLTKELNDNWNKIAPVTFGLQDEIPETNLDEASVDIRAFYLGSKCIAANETLDQLENVYSDRNFIYGVRQNILHHAKASPVYPYIFDYVDEDSTIGQFMFGNKIDLSGKVLHGEDNKYVFGFKSAFGPFTTLGNRTELVDFSKKYVKFLVSFVKTGKPDVSILGGGDEEWPPVNSTTTQEEANGEEPLQWYHLNSVPTLGKGNEVFTDRMAFWDNLLKKYTNH